MKTSYANAFLALALICACRVSAFDHNAGKGGANVVKRPTPVTRGAGCAPSSAPFYMSFNDVSCKLETGGLLFLDRFSNNGTYKVPKTGNATAIFAASLWMGGLDATNQLKLAAVKFRRDGNDFWPGPLTVNPGSGNYDPLVAQGDNVIRAHGDANTDADMCKQYDYIFTIRKAEVIAFITYWECHYSNPFNPDHIGCEDVPKPDNEVLARINAWPGNGPDSQYDQFLAPFFDRNQDGKYDPDLTEEGGDYPWYDDILGRDNITCGRDRRVTLFGDETHWWVFNDKGNIHTESGGEPISMEIHAQAFAFATDDEINKMTFYNYEMINRGTQTLNQTYFSQYVDSDLGNPTDDYVGCDVSRGLGYCYNGDSDDETQSGQIGYGQNPPAIGVDFFEGPYQDADNQANPLITDGPNPVETALQAGGIVYPGLGIGYSDTIRDNERFGMRRFCYFTGTGALSPSQSDPESMGHYYNYMSGKWRGGEEMYYGGTGFSNVPGVEADYMFPDDSDPLFWGTQGVPTSNDWSEVSSNNQKGDRRFVQSAGPFTLKPGAVNNITVGIVFGQGTGGDLFASVRALKRADTKAQALFDNCFRIVEPPHAPVLTVQELNNELILMLDNPKNVSNNDDEDYIEEDRINIDPSYTDRYYRFEGYQIYQMADQHASVSDLDDPTKARIVAQCDIRNGVGRLINLEFDQSLGFSTPVEKVNAEDKGIRHTFRITEDQFATGSRTLVNHKRYYYIAVAYGYNNYKTYDPLTAPEGQKMPYLRSRINANGTPLESVEGIPHNPMPEQGGTLQLAEYGATPRITRLDGFGNGNRELAFTPETEAEIVANGFMQTPEYDYGHGPLNVKVVDPLNVKGGYYTIKFNDYADIDTASWTIYQYTEKAGELLDSVESDRTILTDNEQIIPQWGISVQIYQKQHVAFGNVNETGKYTEPISATCTFLDSSKRWLNFVHDDGQLFPSNWIRTGSYNPIQASVCDPLPQNYLNPCCYKDEVGKDPKELYSKLLDGGIAPQKLTGYQCDFMPLAYPQAFVAFSGSRARASISFAPSIELVITDDTTKWTRCVVIELGRDHNLNVGGAKPGELRRSLSVNKKGKPDGSETYGMGWFPGYALDLETGARLHMAFGENSFLVGDHGNDMRWNPTSEYVDANGTPVLGGQHPIYVFGTKVGYGGFSTDAPYYDGENNWVYDQYMEASVASYGELFSSLMWIVNPILEKGHDLQETDVRISVHVNKEYKNYTATGDNNGKPMYAWEMDKLQTGKPVRETLASALDLINVVPNPYYAFSEYERNRLDTRVKITNLPDRCTVTIYNVSGKMVRQFRKDNQITSLEWDLKNTKGIPVASGVYLIHVDVPGVGEKIVKFFGGMRQVDMENL